MIDSYVPSPIPFYLSINRTDWKQKSCQAFEPYQNPVLADADTSISLLNGIDIRTDVDPGSVGSVFLLPWGGGDTIILDPTAFAIASSGDPGVYVIYMQPAVLSAPGIVLNTHYYLIVEAGSGSYTSECIYTFDGTDTDYPRDCNDDRKTYFKVAWSSPCLIKGGGALETGGYMLYLEGEIGRPEWSATESGDEDSQGQEVPDYQRVRKRMSITFDGSLYIADALVHTLLYDTRTIEFDDGLIWNFRDPKVNVAWNDTGCSAAGNIEFSFEIDGLYRTGCSSDCE